MHISRSRPSERPTPAKAYKNEDFLNGPHGRLLRIQCEFEEPRVRLAAQGIENIVMIFGSARSKTPEAYEKALSELREKVKSDTSVQPQLTRMERMQFLCKYHDETVKLARLITEFSMGRKAKGLPVYTVGTGGGPGMMQAANEGAWRAGGQSAGFGISLPFEKGLNPFVTPELAFEFHYFFTRKFWMAYKCMGLVVSPGGYGTCDELYEILTLIQTDKIKRRLPVILLGAEYWSQVLRFEEMERYALIDKDWQSMVFTCDSADAAFEHLKKYWLSFEASGVAPSPLHKPVCRVEPPVKRLRLNDEAEIPDRPMPPKAYKNLDFIKSQHCRVLRIQCEFEETRHRLDEQGISNTLVFVGSSTVKSHEDHLACLAKAAQDPVASAAELDRLSRQQPLLRYHQVARDLARRITAWSMERTKHGKASYHVATGGAPGGEPGLLESANEGAWEAGGKSLAFGCSGGAGQTTTFNRYVTPELAFIFNYFFTRKFWMAYKCMGMVVLPGGWGTCDQFFELLTLIQTGKIRRKLPIVFVGTEYWHGVIHWRKMADYGMISDEDVDQLCFTDSADEAFQHITQTWESQEQDGQVWGSPKKKAKK